MIADGLVDAAMGGVVGLIIVTTAALAEGNPYDFKEVVIIPLVMTTISRFCSAVAAVVEMCKKGRDCEVVWKRDRSLG